MGMDETTLNPYQPPSPDLTAVSELGRTSSSAPLGLVCIAAILIVGVLVGMAAVVYQPLSLWTMPRFGWIGLILCANPLIFVYPCWRMPTKVGYWTLSFILAFMAVSQGIEILFHGTVAVVQRPYNDRLHSAWLWAVVPYVLMCLYALWQSTQQAVFMITREHGSGVALGDAASKDA